MLGGEGGRVSLCHRRPVDHDGIGVRRGRRVAEQVEPAAVAPVDGTGGFVAAGDSPAAGVDQAPVGLLADRAGVRFGRRARHAAVENVWHHGGYSSSGRRHPGSALAATGTGPSTHGRRPRLRNRKGELLVALGGQESAEGFEVEYDAAVVPPKAGVMVGQAVQLFSVWYERQAYSAA